MSDASGVASGQGGLIVSWKRVFTDHESFLSHTEVCFSVSQLDPSTQLDGPFSMCQDEDWLLAPDAAGNNSFVLPAPLSDTLVNVSAVMAR